jgi:hypothetical protein
MLMKTRKSAALLACAVVALAGLAAAAADGEKDAKDKPALSGAWAKKEGELKLEFADKGVLRIVPHGKDEVLVVLCSYSAAKGEVKAKVSGFEGKEGAQEKAKELLPVGTEFRFKWEVKGDAGTLGDVKGDKADVLKGHVEGKYERVK